MMPKSKGWRLLWLAWVVGVPLVAGLLVLSLFSRTKCLPVTAEMRSMALMNELCNAAQLYQFNTDEWPAEEPAGFARQVGNSGPRTYQLVQFDPSELNARREPVDAWGGLLRFHFSRVNVRIASAGKDRLFGTADDLVAER